MPSVPTYDTFQVREQALPAVRTQRDTSAGLFEGNARHAGQLGNALNNTGQGLGDIVRQEQERENADMIFRAETSLKNAYAEYEAAARDRKGQNAWGVTNDTKAWFDKQIQEHSDGLQNDAQKKVFRQTVERLRLQSLSAFSAYEGDQRRKSLEESAQASIVGSTDLAAGKARAAERGEQTEAGYAQAFDISAEKTDILKRVQVLSQINGWPPELRAAKEKEYLTNFHKQIIQARVDIDPQGAKAYFAANKGEINGVDHDAIDKALRVGGLKETAQSFADEVGKSGMSEADALAAAREKFSGEEEAATVTEIKTRFAEATQARERAQRTAGDQAWGIFAKTRSLSAIPASVMSAMDGRDLESLRAHARAAVEGRAVKTDAGTYLSLSEMVRDDPEKFRELNLRQYAGKLSLSDLEEFAKIQRANPKQLKEALTIKTQIDKASRDFAITDKDELHKFDATVRQAVQTAQDEKGRPLNHEERQKIIDQMVVDGEVLSGHWYTNDPNKKFYQVYGTAEEAKFSVFVPRDARKEIVDRFKAKKGRNPSEQEVLDSYRRLKGF